MISAQMTKSLTGKVNLLLSVLHFNLVLHLQTKTTFKFYKPLTLMSDHDIIIFPYHILKKLSRLAMGIKKNINYGIIKGFNTKFSKLKS